MHLHFLNVILEAFLLLFFFLETLFFLYFLSTFVGIDEVEFEEETQEEEEEI